MPTIALFGTSADPPTNGHQTILDWLSQHYDHVAVWAANNPFKAHQTSLDHRMAMLQLLIDGLPDRANVGLYPDLSHTRTIHTLAAAQQRWPNGIFTLAIGADLVNQLPKWYQAQQLLSQVNLLVIPRPGYTIAQAALAELRRMGARVAIADLIGLDTSSTHYREQGEPSSLTPPVAAYIHRENLYSCQDASSEKQPAR